MTFATRRLFFSMRLIISYRWNLAVHGCIDEFSRLIPHLRVTTDNTAITALNVFFEEIKEYGVPSRVRADKGTEFNHVNSFMKNINGDQHISFITGKSVHNQRIERLWRL